MAQLGARLNGIEEVEGSNPSGSTGKRRTAHHPGRAVCVYVTLDSKGKLDDLGLELSL